MEFLELIKTLKNNVQWVRLNSRVEGTEERNQWPGRYNNRNYPIWKIKNTVKKLTEPQICGTITKDLTLLPSESQKERRKKARWKSTLKYNGWKLPKFGRI